MLALVYEDCAYFYHMRLLIKVFERIFAVGFSKQVIQPFARAHLKLFEQLPK